MKPNLNNLQHYVRRIPDTFHNIRTELFFSYFLIIFLCIAIVGTVSTYYASRSAIEMSEQANMQIAKQIQKSLDRDFQHKRDALLSPYYDSFYIDGISRYSYMEQSEQYLFRQRIGDLYLMRFYVLPQHDFVRFSIYHSNGEMLYHSDGYQRPVSYHSTNMLWYMRTVANNGTVYFSGAYKDPDPAYDRKLFSSSILIRDFSLPDEFIIVRAEYNVQLLDELSENANISEGSNIVIFDEQGQVVYSSLHTPNGTWYRQLAEQVNGSKGPFWTETEQGEALQVTSMSSDKADWDIVLLTPESDIFSAGESIKRFTIFTVCIAFAFTSILSILFSKRLTNPIRELHQTVNRIKMGDLSVRVKVARKNELGRIAQNFNTVADELEQLIESRYVNEIKLKEAELAALYAQINPHFLYNTLESIRAMAELNHAKEASRMASALGELFRYNTKQTGDLVTVKEEIEQIKQYLTIQNIRFGDKVRSSIEVDDGLWDAQMLKMTLQPLVENAVLHGLEKVKGGGEVTIRVSRVQVFIGQENASERANETTNMTQIEAVRVEVIDSGAGIPKDVLHTLRTTLKQSNTHGLDNESDARGGIGMRNVISRYHIRYGRSFHFELDSESGHGTRAILIFPLSLHKNEKSDYST